jgi:hypothetical protein
MTGKEPRKPRVPPQAGSFPEQDENGVDLSLIRENLRLSPIERLRKAERARKSALRLQEYGRRHRAKV